MPAKLNIVNMGKDFELFWAQARGRNFTEQLAAWDAHIEHKHQDFFDELVWWKPLDESAKQRRLLKLEEIFKRYPDAAAKIIKEFNNFETTVSQQLALFEQKFPEAQFEDLQIYAAVAPTFNGKYAFLGDQKVLAFGVDLSVLLKNRPDILFSHELFHIYHNQALQIDKASFGKVKLSIPLWAEGLATYASQEMNPHASASDIFMDNALGQIEEKHLRELSRLYLPLLNFSLEERSSESERWFSGSSKLNEHFPPRTGYWLGFKVAQLLRRKHSLAEMTAWKQERAHNEVTVALTELSKSPE